MKKGKEKIYEAFGDRKAVLVVGLLCFFYFVLFFSSQLGPLAQILPPLPHPVFTLLALLVLAAQCAVWRMLGLFHPRWFLNFSALLLFFCEFMVLLFAIVFLSWPFYLFGAYLAHQAHKVY